VTRLSAAVGLVALALIVTGCAAAEPADTQSPEQSQDHLLSLLDDVQTQIGGEWTNEDSPSPRGCQLAGGAEGVTFTGTRTLEAQAVTDAQVDDLVAYLSDQGFDAGRSSVGVLVDVLAVDPDDETSFVEVRIGDQSTQLKGQAACAAGDINVELDRVKSEQ
jgi:hypothetical protein